MCKVAIIGVLQQQAEALGTQFRPIYALYNDQSWNTNIKEMNSSERIIYCSYRSAGIKQEAIEILKLLKKISPNIIYINSLRQLFTIGLLIRSSNIFSARPIIIATSHNSLVWKSTVKRLLISVLFQSMADGVLTLASFQEKWLRKYGVPASKIRTISNAVDVNQFSPTGFEPHLFNPDSPVLINVGELNPLKNQETLIRALGIIKKAFPGIKLILTGGRVVNDAYINYIKSLICECNVGENVIDVGYHEHWQVPQLLRSSDISLISSLSEVSPFIVLESLATGKVTISTAVGGIPDLIKSDYNGFLVEPCDINGFADCIRRVLQDPILRSTIERNAREWAESNLSYKAIGEKHKEFISALLENRSRN